MMKIIIYLFILLFVLNIKNTKSNLISDYCNSNETQCLIEIKSSSPIFIQCDPVYSYNYNFPSPRLKKIVFINTLLSAVPDIFQCLHQLVEINIDNCQLTNINFKNMGNLVNLKKLSLQYNRLGGIDRDTFYHLSQLKILQLGNNQIIYINENSLNDIIELQYLELNNNDIEELSPLVFKTLRNLNYIDLSYNKIKEIPANLFDDNDLLHTIILNNNKIVNLDSDVFKNIKFFNVLDLSGNNIAKIRINIIDTLRIVDAQLEEIEIVENIVNLYASKNHIKNVTIADKRFVREIDLSSNVINSMKMFENMYALEKLNIAKNPIQTINLFDFITLHNLLILNMDSTLLQSIKNDTFSSLYKLTALDLANNHLIELNENALKPLKYLERFYIGGNQLLHINYEAITKNNNRLKQFGVSAKDFNFTYLTKMNEFFNSHNIAFDVRTKTIKTYNYNESTKVEKQIETHHYHHHYNGSLTATNILIVIILIMVVIFLVIQFAKKLSTQSVQNVVNRLRSQTNRSRIDEQESEPL